MVSADVNQENIFDDREPVTPFEEMILKAIDAKISESVFKNLFLKTQFYVCERKIKGKGSGHKQPLLHDSEFGTMYAAFSTRYRMIHFQSEINGYAVVWGRELITKLPDEMGIILNPDSLLSFQLSAERIAKIKNTLI